MDEKLKKIRRRIDAGSSVSAAGLGLYFACRGAGLPLPVCAALAGADGLLSLAVLAPCALLAVRLQPGKDNLVGMDPNLALFAAGFLLYTVFNAVFLPTFYRNGYKVGAAFIKALIPVTLVMVVCEALPHLPGWGWLDDLDGATQLRLLPVLAVSAAVYAAGMLLSFRRAAALYEKVDL